jgi:hypothetical protein
LTDPAWSTDDPDEELTTDARWSFAFTFGGGDGRSDGWCGYCNGGGCTPICGGIGYPTGGDIGAEM